MGALHYEFGLWRFDARKHRKAKGRHVAYLLQAQYICYARVLTLTCGPKKTGGFGPPAGWTFRREEFAHDLERTTAWKRHDGIKMSFLLFLRGLIGVLLVFAITTYVITQSLWTTLIQTVICAVLLQVGYFVAVLFLVWRSAGRPEAEETPAKNEILQNLPKEDQTGEVSRLPGVPRSGHP